MTPGRTRQEALVQAIRLDRGELQRAVGDIRAAARGGVALRRRVADRPVAWLAGAFVVGYALGRRGH